MPRIRAQAARLAAVALVAAVLPGCAVLRSDPPPPSARVQADGSRLVTVVRGDDLYQLSVRHKVQSATS